MTPDEVIAGSLFVLFLALLAILIIIIYLAIVVRNSLQSTTNT